MNKEKISDLFMIFFISIAIIFYPRQGKAKNEAWDTGILKNKGLHSVQPIVSEYPEARSPIIMESSRFYMIMGNTK